MPDEFHEKHPSDQQVRPVSRGSPHHWEPPLVAELQVLLPQYEILELIGHGGMGAVYKGRQPNLDRIVAIKILPPELGDHDPEFVERFKGEALAMGRLNHTGIVTVHDFGQMTGGLCYLSMEFIEGEDVEHMIRRKGRLDPARALAIAAHICDALHYAHAQGVIHRDIKPSNIIINHEGWVKIVDFGLAKATNNGANSGLTQSGDVLGTLHYLSPEALADVRLADHRADLYAVGVMLYKMLTGAVPHGMFQKPSEVVPELDSRYDDIIARALQSDKNRRYQSGQDFRRDLEAIFSTHAATSSAVTERCAASPDNRGNTLPSSNAEKSDVTGSTLSSGRQPQALNRRVREISKSQRARPKTNVPILRNLGIGAAIVMMIAGAIYALATSGRSKLRDNAGAGSSVVGNEATKPSIHPAEMSPPPRPPAAPELIPSKKHTPSVTQTNGNSVTDTATASKDRPFINSLDMRFVPVPGTKALFSIWDTRIQDFEKFAKATSHPVRKANHEQGPTHPVVNVKWEDAKAFCAWLTGLEQRNGIIGLKQEYRLPTDEEWSIAVGLPKETGSTPSAKSGQIKNIYPWGTSWPPPKGAGNYLGEGETPNSQKAPGMFRGEEIAGYRDGFEKTAPVGTFAANAFGLYDMGGNVDQFVEDWYDEKQDARTLRGDSWWSALRPREQMLSSFRRRHQLGYAVNDAWGFRCVLAASTSASSNAPVTATGPGAVPASTNLPQASVASGARLTNYNLLPPSIRSRCGNAERLQKISEAGGSPETERAVSVALEYLKTKQKLDGSWGTTNKAGMTALALLCFLGHCETPDSPVYGDNVIKGILWLMETARKNHEGLFSEQPDKPAATYEHAIATCALGEMYVLARLGNKSIPGIREAFENGISVITRHQHQTGGWGYGTGSYSDIGRDDPSVTGWQYQALKAAKISGLKLDGNAVTIDKTVKYLETIQSKDGGFGGTNRASGAYSQWTMTGVGVLALQTLAQGKTIQIGKGVKFAHDFFQQEPPNWAMFNVYSSYYFTQMFFQNGGREWSFWQGNVMSLIVSSQEKDGSWIKSSIGGEYIYPTTFCTLMLETYYREARPATP